MAILNATNPTLLDVLNRTDPAGKLMNLVEPLKWATPFLEDATWVEANQTTGHIFASRTGLPSLYWRKFNEGTLPSKDRTNQVTETIGMLAGQNKIDVQLAKLNGNEAAYRAQIDAAFMQSYARTLESAFFYSSTKSSPEQILGLAPRLDVTSGNPAASQIIKHDPAAAGADSASMYLVVWGPSTVYCIYPKGSQGGLEHKDMGEQLTDDGSGQNKQFRAYVTDWTWKTGLVVQDSRYLVRLCNIDDTTLSTTGSALIASMINMVNQVQDLNSGRAVIYANRKMLTRLQQQSVDSTKNSTLTYDNVGGKPVMQFMGIPIKRTDALINTESPVV